MTTDDFKIVDTGEGHAVTYNAAFVGYMMGGKRVFIVGTRMQVENQLRVFIEYADFTSTFNVFEPRKAA